MNQADILKSVFDAEDAVSIDGDDIQDSIEVIDENAEMLAVSIAEDATDLLESINGKVDKNEEEE